MSNVLIRLLPDGTGRVKIHWFERTETGPIQTAGGSIQTGAGPMYIGGAKGRIACSPDLKTLLPGLQQGMTVPVQHTDDPRAATCPECLATPEYKALMKLYAEQVETADQR